jgi:hypothetical protein
MTPDTERMVIEALREVVTNGYHACDMADEWTISGAVYAMAADALSAADREAQSGGDCLNLVDRLRGIYRVPVNDGAGPLNGSMTHTRKFETPPIQHEAAATIERLSRDCICLKEERTRLTRELAEAREAIEIAAEAGFEWPAASPTTQAETR